MTKYMMFPSIVLPSPLFIAGYTMVGHSVLPALTAAGGGLKFGLILTSVAWNTPVTYWNLVLVEKTTESPFDVSCLTRFLLCP